MSDPYGRSLPARDPRREAPPQGYNEQAPPQQQGYGYAPPRQGYQQQQPGQGYQDPRGQRPYGDDRPPPRRKRRRIFLWVFLAIQALFIIWVITGLATKSPSDATQIAQQCYNHHWFPLFKSQADCVTHFGGAMNTAGNVGKGLGIALIVVLWFVVDVILGISYGVYRLATRDRYR